MEPAAPAEQRPQRVTVRRDEGACGSRVIGPRLARSASISARVAGMSRRRFTSRTTQSSRPSRGCCSRNASRTRRRIRLRVTARGADACGTTSRVAGTRPRRETVEVEPGRRASLFRPSAPRRHAAPSRCSRRSRWPACGARFRRRAAPALGATRADHRPSAAGAHAHEKAMRPLAPDDGGLVTFASWLFPWRQKRERKPGIRARPCKHCQRRLRACG